MLVACAPLTRPHLTRVHQLELLEFRVELQAELLQLDGVRGLKALPVLLQAGRQVAPLRRFLRHVNRAQCVSLPWKRRATQSEDSSSALVSISHPR